MFAARAGRCAVRAARASGGSPCLPLRFFCVRPLLGAPGWKIAKARLGGPRLTRQGVVEHACLCTWRGHLSRFTAPTCTRLCRRCTAHGCKAHAHQAHPRQLFPHPGRAPSRPDRAKRGVHPSQPQTTRQVSAVRPGCCTSRPAAPFGQRSSPDPAGERICCPVASLCKKSLERIRARRRIELVGGGKLSSEQPLWFCVRGTGMTAGVKATSRYASVRRG